MKLSIAGKKWFVSFKKWQLLFLQPHTHYKSDILSLLHLVDSRTMVKFKEIHPYPSPLIAAMQAMVMVTKLFLRNWNKTTLMMISAGRNPIFTRALYLSIMRMIIDQEIIFLLQESLCSSTVPGKAVLFHSIVKLVSLKSDVIKLIIKLMSHKVGWLKLNTSGRSYSQAKVFTAIIHNLRWITPYPSFPFNVFIASTYGYEIDC